MGKKLLICLSFMIIYAYSFAQEYACKTRFNYYTNEHQAELILLDVKKGISHSPELELLVNNTKTDFELIPHQNEALRLSFDIRNLEDGVHPVILKIKKNRLVLNELNLNLIKLEPKYNAVKIDRLTGGLLVNDKAWFPFGFYCYSPVPENLAGDEAIKAFNMMSPYQKISGKSHKESRKYMDRCAEVGMKVHYNLLSIAGGGGVGSARNESMSLEERKKRIALEIERFKNHPALLAWYISDEPSGHGESAEDLEEIYQLIKEKDPYHPVSMVFMNPQAARTYANALDIIMADPYPLPRREVTEVDWVSSRLKKEFAYEKPIWIVPQAFGGNEWWQREPTRHEMRVMTYLALIRNATGVQYFIRKGPNAFPKSAISWAECSRIAHEVQELTPFLLSPDDPGKAWTNAPSVRTKAWKYQNKILIITVNAENKPHTYKLTLPQIPVDKKLYLPFENRHIDAKTESIDNMIAAFGVNVYIMQVSEDHEDMPFVEGNLLINAGFEKNPSVGVPSGCYAKNLGDPGATYFIDSRNAIEGMHSLRLITPRNNKGMELSFYPADLENGNSYTFSIWAKADTASHKKEKRNFFRRLFYPDKEESMSFTIEIGSFGSKSFQLSNTWEKYEFFVNVPRENTGNNRTRVNLSMESNGAAWFDMMQLYQNPVLHVREGKEQAFLCKIESPGEGSKIFYTLDGSVPDTSDQEYQDEILIDSNAHIVAGVFRQGNALGMVRKSLYVHKALNKKVKYISPWSGKYPAKRDKTLTDGIRGSMNFRDGRWQGFFEDDMELILDLKKAESIHEISSFFMQDVVSLIVFPEEVRYSFSNDGKLFTDEVIIKNKIPPDTEGVFVHEFSESFQELKARYIKVMAKNIGHHPNWEKSSGGGTWLFIDEIIVH